MARKLKPVDDTPICDPAYVRRMDPIWMPGPVPRYFWEDRAHRRDYLLWSAKRLGLRTMRSLYRLSLVECYRRNHGSGLANYWVISPLAAVRECFPRYDWMPWLFAQVPAGFWESPANRRSYLDWLGKQMGFRRAEDWYRIRVNDFVERHGATLVQAYPSLYDLMREFLPQLDWDRVDRYRPVGVGEIIAWADVYYAAHGKWPTLHSGQIPGTGHTWSQINDRLRNGMCGFRSLAKLLCEKRGVPVGRRPPLLSEEQILAWADAYFATEQKWPGANCGPIAGTLETWGAVNACLHAGRRGLPGGCSLAQLLAKRRGTRNHLGLPPLTEKQILAWADAHFAAHGSWPNRKSGPIPDTQETWISIDGAMRSGCRGFRSRCSLANVLARRRGVRNRTNPPPLAEKQILAWADAHFAAHGSWPNADSGPIPGRQESWTGIDLALRKAGRGLGRHCSLAQLLAERRGTRNLGRLPPLTEKQILVWADAHFATHGIWPTRTCGAVAGTQETWGIVANALVRGLRGLPGGSSLARLLNERRGVPNRACLPPLAEEQILAWADAHFATYGKWPTQASGMVHGAQVTWRAIESALTTGLRGLPGGASLARLLAKRRGVKNRAALPPLTERQILLWAKQYFRTEGKWPSAESGPIAQSPGGNWAAVDSALGRGHRGLPGGSSLAKLLRKHGLK